MNIAFLPNVFKKVSLFLFVVSFGFGYQCAIKGWQDAGAGKSLSSAVNDEQHGLADWLIIFSILTYFLSKEKWKTNLLTNGGMSPWLLLSLSS